MSAQLLDGVSIAKQIKAEVAEEVKILTDGGIRPGLAAVLVGSDPASQVYVGSKVKTCETLGLYSEKHELPAETTTEELRALITELNRRDEIDGILVQMPLPAQINADAIIGTVDARKDVDGFHPVNIGRLAIKLPSFVACTPAGIMEMLSRSNIPVAGKQAVVLGRSRIVGLPMALLLMHADATVTVCHSKTADIKRVISAADILIAAIGRAAYVMPEHVKPGAAVIDVGINKLTDAAEIERYFPGDEKRRQEFEKKGYTLIGDAAPACAGVAGYYTPVPGGVGPLTIAMLMKNTVLAAKLRRGPQAKARQAR